MKSKHAESIRSLSTAPARFETFKNELASGLLDLENTMSRAMSCAERESIAVAQMAHSRGKISQRETSPGSGVWMMVRQS